MNKEFNWAEFHKNLDIAMAILINETGVLPSNFSLMEFARFTFNKKKRLVE